MLNYLLDNILLIGGSSLVAGFLGFLLATFLAEKRYHFNRIQAQNLSREALRKQGLVAITRDCAADLVCTINSFPGFEARLYEDYIDVIGPDVKVCKSSKPTRNIFLVNSHDEAVNRVVEFMNVYQSVNTKE